MMKAWNSLLDQIENTPRLAVLTGAGISAASGIPTYRDDTGNWIPSEPIQHQAFLTDGGTRQRYWARSMLGWVQMAKAQPNASHYALAALEKAGAITTLTTQNVDGLHQQAGHKTVIDLHGRLDQVTCLQCDKALSRTAVQQELERLNPGFAEQDAALRPDGDADVPQPLVSRFSIPSCGNCDGILMPDVVFFGGTVPRERVERTEHAIDDADALLVVGSSLTVFSGFRFARLAHRLDKPLYILNRGQTRADELATLKIDSDCGATLTALAQHLSDNKGGQGVPS